MAGLLLSIVDSQKLKALLASAEIYVSRNETIELNTDLPDSASYATLLEQNMFTKNAEDKVFIVWIQPNEGEKINDADELPFIGRIPASSISFIVALTELASNSLSQTFPEIHFEFLPPSITRQAINKFINRGAVLGSGAARILTGLAKMPEIISKRSIMVCSSAISHEFVAGAAFKAGGGLFFQTTLMQRTLLSLTACYKRCFKDYPAGDAGYFCDMLDIYHYVIHRNDTTPPDHNKSEFRKDILDGIMQIAANKPDVTIPEMLKLMDKDPIFAPFINVISNLSNSMTMVPFFYLKSVDLSYSRSLTPEKISAISNLLDHDEKENYAMRLGAGLGFRVLSPLLYRCSGLHIINTQEEEREFLNKRHNQAKNPNQNNISNKTDAASAQSVPVINNLQHSKPLPLTIVVANISPTDNKVTEKTAHSIVHTNVLQRTTNPNADKIGNNQIDYATAYLNKHTIEKTVESPLDNNQTTNQIHEPEIVKNNSSNVHEGLLMHTYFNENTFNEQNSKKYYNGSNDENIPLPNIALTDNDDIGDFGIPTIIGGDEQDFNLNNSDAIYPEVFNEPAKILTINHQQNSNEYTTNNLFRIPGIPVSIVSKQETAIPYATATLAGLRQALEINPDIMNISAEEIKSAIINIVQIESPVSFEIVLNHFYLICRRSKTPFRKKEGRNRIINILNEVISSQGFLKDADNMIYQNNKAIFVRNRNIYRTPKFFQYAKYVSHGEIAAAYNMIANYGNLGIIAPNALDIIRLLGLSTNKKDLNINMDIITKIIQDFPKIFITPEEKDKHNSN